MSDNNFEYTSRLRMRFLGVLILGWVLVIIGMAVSGMPWDRFWSNFLLETMYFLGISVLAVFTLASHQIALAGWYVNIKRIPEALSQFSFIGAVCMLIVIGGVWFGYNHLYDKWNNDFIKQEKVTQSDLTAYAQDHPLQDENKYYEREWQNFQVNYPWKGAEEAQPGEAEAGMEMTADSTGMVANPYYDKEVAGKSSYLNRGFWTFRSLLYLFLWVLIAYKLRTFSKKEDKLGTVAWYMKSKVWSAIFLVIWAVSGSMMAWDWLMSLEPRWSSTMFGWYNFISLWVTSLSATVLILIYLKRRGYMPQLNENHLHDVGKLIFGFSIFWTYLWFSQFMLIWYGNLPEETSWMLERARTSYGVLFYTNLFVNFLFPFLVLMRRDAKRNMLVLGIVATGLLIGHWIDLFVEIMPATVGSSWHIGLVEIGMFLGFAGMFLMFVFRELSKASLIPQRHPMYMESVDHHQ